MSIYHVNGTAFGSKSGALILGAAPSTEESVKAHKQFAEPQPGSDENLGDVAMWGSNNLLPQEMSEDLGSTSVLGAAVDGKARIVVGKGPMPCRQTDITPEGKE